MERRTLGQQGRAQDAPQFCQPVAFSRHHPLQGAIHFPVTSVIKKHIHAKLAGVEPVGHIPGVQNDFHPVALHVVDDALFFRFVYMGSLCKQAYGLASAQLVRAILMRGSLHDDECFFPKGESGVRHL
jgi:hypothetical protein